MRRGYECSDGGERLMGGPIPKVDKNSGRRGGARQESASEANPLTMAGE